MLQNMLQTKKRVFPTTTRPSRNIGVRTARTRSSLISSGRTQADILMEETVFEINEFEQKHRQQLIHEILADLEEKQSNSRIKSGL